MRDEDAALAHLVEASALARRLGCVLRTLPQCSMTREAAGFVFADLGDWAKDLEFEIQRAVLVLRVNSEARLERRRWTRAVRTRRPHRRSQSSGRSCDDGCHPDRRAAPCSVWTQALVADLVLAAPIALCLQMVLRDLAEWAIDPETVRRILADLALWGTDLEGNVDRAAQRLAGRKTHEGPDRDVNSFAA